MNRKTKILFISGGPLDYGGISTWMYNYLTNLDPAIFDISILVHGGTGNREKYFADNDITIYHVPFYRNCFFKYKKLINNVLDNDFDIIHSHMDAANSRVLKIAKEKCDILTISHVHSSFFLNSDFFHKVYHFINKKKLNKYSDYLFACSKEAGKFYYGQTSEFEIIPNAIIVEPFKFVIEKRNLLRSNYKIKNDVFVIGQIGHICDNKNQIFTINILSELLKTNNKYYLVFIGDGDDAILKEKIKELRMQNHVLFLGEKANASDFYNMFDCLVQPSLKEGTPLTCIEAQYNGLSVLASTNISTDTCISSLIQLLPLKKEVWCESLNKISISKDKKMHRDKHADFYSAKYDISVSSKILQNFYITKSKKVMQ